MIDEKFYYRIRSAFLSTYGITASTSLLIGFLSEYGSDAQEWFLSITSAMIVFSLFLFSHFNQLIIKKFVDTDEQKLERRRKAIEDRQNEKARIEQANINYHLRVKFEHDKKIKLRKQNKGY